MAFHNASGGTSDVVYVRDEAGNPLYSWTVPTSGETITGTPQWTTISSKHYVFVATSAGKVYRLVDTRHHRKQRVGDADAGRGDGVDHQPVQLRVHDQHAAGDGRQQRLLGKHAPAARTSGRSASRTSRNPTPVAITPAVTNAALTIASVSNTTYAFMGVTGSALKISTAGNSLTDTNSTTGMGTINGRIVVGYNKSGTQRVYAGDDAGNMWALDPGTAFADVGRDSGNIQAAAATPSTGRRTTTTTPTRSSSAPRVERSSSSPAAQQLHAPEHGLPVHAARRRLE